MEEILNYNSDDEVPSVQHNKLLSVVSKLYEKKRVQAPVRNELSLEVSEFHLTQAGDRRKERVHVNALAKVLNRRASHVGISKNLRLAQKTAKTLPKPLEKPQAQKIVREVGYENVKKQLNRWDAIVYNQRVAEQVKYPLKSSTVNEYKSDFLSRFRTATPLEQEVERILKESAALNAEKEKESTDHLAEENDEEEFPLTLEEIMERRQLVAKVRAQQSYKQYKARRQNKIKSKKYHRILKRQRIKDQLREFEELQKKDPEAALKKLELLEKTRAEERVSLRHRSTGQWAKNQAVRAKYNKEARIALAEQLAKSRELTAKLRIREDSSDEEGENEEKVITVDDTDKNNPWTSKAHNEVEAFNSSYRKFWNEKNKETEKQTETDKGKNGELESVGSVSESNMNSNKNNTKRNDKKVNFLNKNFGKINISLTSNTEKTDSAETNSEPSFMEQNSILSDDQNCNEEIGPRIKVNSRKKDVPVKKIKDTKNKLGRISVESSETVNDPEQAASCKQTVPVDLHNNKDTLGNIPFLRDVKKAKVRKVARSAECLPSNTTKEVLNRSGCWIVSEEVKRTDDKVIISKKNIKHDKKGKKKTKKRSENSVLQKSVNINEIFDQMEDKLRTACEGKASTLKKQLASLGDKKESPEENTENGNKNNPSLEMTKQNLTADIDEELQENSGHTQEQKSVFDELTKVITSTGTEDKKTSQSDDVDPNKVFSATPKHLNSKLPDLITEGEDALDDEEEAEDGHLLTITEAFADDDIVEAFRREKDEEIKKNAVEDVDLSMPGWGHWAGHNIEHVPQRRRKKFALNIPEKLPRKDDSKCNVIINEDMDAPLKEHRVSEIPYPFTSIRDFEASIRAPVGRNWIPQIAHRKLIAPPVITKLGTVIEPMEEDQLVQQKKLKIMEKIKKYAKRKSH